MAKTLRADARANHDRLLEVAAAAFASKGADATLKSIAAEAGVGIGTLYRRFPRREDLVEAVYREETDRLAEAAGRLAVELPPREALTEWMERFVSYMLTKQGMADALPAILDHREGLRAHSRDALEGAVRTLLDAGRRAGQIRPDVDPREVLMALGGITLITGHESEPSLAGRLIRLLLAGVAPAHAAQS